MFSPEPSMVYERMIPAAQLKAISQCARTTMHLKRFTKGIVTGPRAKVYAMCSREKVLLG
jgi:hypothetical protein